MNTEKNIGEIGNRKEMEEMRMAMEKEEIQGMQKIQEIQEIQVETLTAHIGERILLHGSIYKIRKMHGFVFCLLRTPRCIVQCVCDRVELMNELTEEACVRLKAEVVKEERARAGVELHILEVQYLSRPTEPMPIVINQKLVDTSLENRLDFRPLTLRNEKERAVFRVQAGILRGCRRFFEKENFTEIHTPKIVCAGAEGGANIFRLDYFGREAYLAQSPQFYKQMMVGVFERVYEVGPVFRAEKHDTARHLNEYTGVDFEMGYIESFWNIMETEVRLLQSVLETLAEECAYELELLQIELPCLPKEECVSGEALGLETRDLRGESAAFVKGRDCAGIPAVKFGHAKALTAKERGRESAECHDFEPDEEKLLSEIVKRKWGSDFVFVTHYPASKRPFYVMEDPENPGETLSFDLIFRGLEITTGGQRIHDYGMQLEKLRRRGMDPAAFEGFLMMHKHGMPPHGGLGIGLERLTARILGLENVRQACLFPRDIHRLEP